MCIAVKFSVYISYIDYRNRKRELCCPLFIAALTAMKCGQHSQK